MHQLSITPTTYLMQCFSRRHHSTFHLMLSSLSLLHMVSCNPSWNVPSTKAPHTLPLHNKVTLTAPSGCSLPWAGAYILSIWEWNNWSALNSSVITLFNNLCHMGTVDLNLMLQSCWQDCKMRVNYLAVCDCSAPWARPHGICGSQMSRVEFTIFDKKKTLKNSAACYWFCCVFTHSSSTFSVFSDLYLENSVCMENITTISYFIAGSKFCHEYFFI